MYMEPPWLTAGDEGLKANWRARDTLRSVYISRQVQ